MSNPSGTRGLVIKPKPRNPEPKFESPMLGQKFTIENCAIDQNQPAASLPSPLSILRSTRGASASKLPPPGSFSLQTDYRSSDVLHPHLGLNIVKKGNFEYRPKDHDSSGISTSRMKNSSSTMNLSSSPSILMRKENEKPTGRTAASTQGAFLNVYLNPSLPGEWQLKGVTARAQQELKKKLGPQNSAKASQAPALANRKANNMLKQAIDTSALTTLKPSQRLSANLNYLGVIDPNLKSKEKSLVQQDKSRVANIKENDRTKDAYRGHLVRQLQGRSLTRGRSRDGGQLATPKPPSPEQQKPQPLQVPSVTVKPVNMKHQQTQCFNLMNSRNPRHASYFSSVALVITADP
jgi:hypothetical protein